MVDLKATGSTAFGYGRLRPVGQPSDGTATRKLGSRLSERGSLMSQETLSIFTSDNVGYGELGAISPPTMVLHPWFCTPGSEAAGCRKEVQHGNYTTTLPRTRN